MHNAIVPFTNKLGENDIRTAKVQQKISGAVFSQKKEHNSFVESEVIFLLVANGIFD